MLDMECVVMLWRGRERRASGQNVLTDAACRVWAVLLEGTSSVWAFVGEE